MPPLGVNDMGNSPTGTQLADSNEVKAESGSKGNRPQLFKYQITLSLFSKGGYPEATRRHWLLGYVWQSTCLACLGTWTQAPSTGVKREWEKEVSQMGVATHDCNSPALGSKRLAECQKSNASLDNIVSHPGTHKETLSQHFVENSCRLPPSSEFSGTWGLSSNQPEIIKGKSHKGPSNILSAELHFLVLQY